MKKYTIDDITFIVSQMAIGATRNGKKLPTCIDLLDELLVREAVETVKEHMAEEKL